MKSTITGHIETRRNSNNEITGYRAVMSLGRDKITGKTKRAYGKVESKEEAEKRLVQMQAVYSRNELIIPKNNTVEEFMQGEWFEGKAAGS
jgi:hypothetical protein